MKSTKRLALIDVVVLFSLFIPHFALATVACSGCRPLEVQNAPGVGFHFSLGYGTAAVELLNGTLVDVAKIDGSSEYVTAMKLLAEDAVGVRAGKKSTMTVLDFREPLGPETDASLLVRAGRWFRKTAPRGSGSSNARLHDPCIVAISEMMISLRSAVDARHLTSHGPTVYLSIPNFLAKSTIQYEEIFRLSAEKVGLSTFGGQRMIAARSAMEEMYGIGNCHSIHIDEYDSIPDTECELHNGERVTNILSVDYSNQSLGLVLLPREDGMFFPHLMRVAELPDLGAGCVLRSQDPEGYWHRVEDLIREYSCEPGHDIDRLLLVGDRATDADLLAVISKVFQSSETVRAEDYLRRAADHLFASVRSAAREARIGMMTGFELCIYPRHCPRGEGKVPPGMEYTFPERDEL